MTPASLKKASAISVVGLASIFGKIGVGNRTEAATFAVKSGLAGSGQ